MICFSIGCYFLLRCVACIIAKLKFVNKICVTGKGAKRDALWGCCRKAERRKPGAAVAQDRAVVLGAGLDDLGVGRRNHG